MPSRASIALRSAGAAPSTETCPVLAGINPAIRRNTVVLPEPLRPTIPMRASVRVRVRSDRIGLPERVTLALLRMMPWDGWLRLLRTSTGRGQ